MIYTRLTKTAMRICFDAHKEQTDKSGLPYVFHPFHLAEQMKDEATTCVALLHDVVEDSDMTLEGLREAGFPEEIVEAVGAMTHAPDVPYMDYVRAIKRNPIATAVKLADLRHNSDPTRLEVIDEFAERRMERYRAAITILTDNDN